MPGAEAGLETLRDLGERQVRRQFVGAVGRVGAAEHEHEPRPLHADEHVDAELAGRAAELVDVEQRGSRPDEHRDLAVAVPAERGDPARQLFVGLAREDRVDDERLETGIPEPARLGRPRVDVGRGEGDLARVQQDRLAQVLALVGDALLGHLDRGPDELQRLREAHAAQQLTRGGGEDVGGDPRGGVADRRTTG